MNKPRLQVGWRQRYEVWLQAEGRDRDDHEYAARCLDCKNIRWLCELAGDRKEAWNACRAHELAVHV